MRDNDVRQCGIITRRFEEGYWLGGRTSAADSRESARIRRGTAAEGLRRGNNNRVRVRVRVMVL